MTANAKTALLSLLAGIGVIVLLIGAFTELYTFTSGLIAAIAIWIVTGVLRSYWGLKDKDSSRKEAPKKGLDTPSKLLAQVNVEEGLSPGHEAL